MRKTLFVTDKIISMKKENWEPSEILKRNISVKGTDNIIRL